MPSSGHPTFLSLDERQEPFSGEYFRFRLSGLYRRSNQGGDKHTCAICLAIRCLFRHLVRAGVLHNNPFALPRFAYPLTVIRIPLSELERHISEYNASWPKGSLLFQAALVVLAPRAIGTTDALAISRLPECLRTTLGVSPAGYGKTASGRLTGMAGH